MATYDPIIHFYDDPGHPYWPNNMASIKAEIMAIATEHGYTGDTPKTIADAIDALADTLAGEDVSSPRSIAGAIHALAPYIGGGGSLGELVGIEVGSANNTFSVSTTPYDISGETYGDVSNSIFSTTDVCEAAGGDLLKTPSGHYVAINAAVPSDWSTDSLQVYIGDGDEPVTSGFECRKLANGPGYVAFLTMQIPDSDLYIDFGIE